ncbi:MAG: ATP-binding protein [Phycisphaeraceae bacterium]|nr:ATP-binding protein [Phycisphaeraceae bacterium]
MDSMKGAHVRMELLSSPVYTSGARDMVQAVTRRMGFAELDCSQIALAVDEALCNIMRHGYENKPDQPIWVGVWPVDEPGVPGGIRIVIEDVARQIEPEKIKGRELHDVKPGGLGVHVIKEVMDKVTYEKRPGGGMRLTMIKHQKPVPVGGSASDGCEGGKGCHA